MIRRTLGAAKRYVLNRVDSPAVVLLYHRVTKLDRDPQLLSVSPENFYEQVNFLKKTYSLPGIEEFYDFLANKKKWPRGTVILTFDDGYADNFLEALPILESLNSQALFYITSSGLDTDRELWWDELERIFLNDHPMPDYISIEHGDGHIRLDTKTKNDRLKTYHSMHPLLRFATPLARDRIMDHLRSLAGLQEAGRKTHRLLTSNELLQLSHSRSAIIGAHTHNHPSLAVLSYKEQVEEMYVSKDILEKITSKKMEHFSYPYGSRKDYNTDSIKACRQVGFKMVCSNYYDQVHRWTDIMQVPRVLVRDWDLQYFSEFMKKSFSC